MKLTKHRSIRSLITIAALILTVLLNLQNALADEPNASSTVSVTNPNPVVGDSFTATFTINSSGDSLGVVGGRITYDTAYLSCEGYSGEIPIPDTLPDLVNEVYTFSVSYNFKALAPGSTNVSVEYRTELFNTGKQINSIPSSATVNIATPYVASSDCGVVSILTTAGYCDIGLREFYLTVPNSTTDFGFNVTTADPKAKWGIISGGQYLGALPVGVTNFVMRVTAEDGVTYADYVFHVTRQEPETQAPTPTPIPQPTIIPGPTESLPTESESESESESETESESESETESETEESSKEEKPLYVAVKGGKKKLRITDPAIDLPSGFQEETYDYWNDEIRVASCDDLILFCLYDDTADKEKQEYAWYVYDSKDDSVSPFKPLIQEQGSYYLMDMPAEEEVPYGYLVQTKTIEKESYRVFVRDGETDEYLVYALDQDGEKRIYRYASKTGDFYRYQADPVQEKPEETSSESTETEEETEGEGQHGALPPVEKETNPVLKYLYSLPDYVAWIAVLALLPLFLLFLILFLVERVKRKKEQTKFGSAQKHVSEDTVPLFNDHSEPLSENSSASREEGTTANAMPSLGDGESMNEERSSAAFEENGSDAETNSEAEEHAFDRSKAAAAILAAAMVTTSDHEHKKEEESFEETKESLSEEPENASSKTAGEAENVDSVSETEPSGQESVFVTAGDSEHPEPVEETAENTAENTTESATESTPVSAEQESTEEKEAENQEAIDSFGAQWDKIQEMLRRQKMKAEEKERAEQEMKAASAMLSAGVLAATASETREPEGESGEEAAETETPETGAEEGVEEPAFEPEEGTEEPASDSEEETETKAEESIEEATSEEEMEVEEFFEDEEEPAESAASEPEEAPSAESVKAPEKPSKKSSKPSWLASLFHHRPTEEEEEPSDEEEETEENEWNDRKGRFENSSDSSEEEEDSENSDE